MGCELPQGGDIETIAGVAARDQIGQAEPHGQPFYIPT